MRWDQDGNNTLRADTYRISLGDRVFKLTEPGNIKRVVMGEDVGSLVTAEG